MPFPGTVAPIFGVHSLNCFRWRMHSERAIYAKPLKHALCFSIRRFALSKKHWRLS